MLTHFLDQQALAQLGGLGALTSAGGLKISIGACG
jgi:hypothetical protein